MESSRTSRSSPDAKMAVLVGGRERHELAEVGMDKSLSMDDFPWIGEFRELCRNSISWKGCPSSSNLLRFLIRHVSSDISDCLKKSLRAVKLKELIREALPLLIIFRRCEQTKDQNRAAYLERMSDLLAMYIDLELVASKRDVEPQPGRISARLVSSLCVCLENSTEHLLDTLIKVRLMKETHWCILDPVISKILKIIPEHPSSEGAYVRYLLVYRLWRRIHSNLAAKEQINASALSSLGPLPRNLPSYIVENVLPPARTSSSSSSSSSSSTISASRGSHDSLTTKYCLYQQFDLRKACVQFMRYCARRCDDEENAIPPPREQRLKNDSTSTTNEVESSSISSHSNSVSKSNFISKVRNIPSLSLANDSINEKTSSSNNATKKPLVTSAVVRKEKKSNQLDDVVLIDLTDEEASKVVRRQKPRKIGWLDDARRNIKAKLKEAAALKKGKEISQSSPKIPDEKQQPEDAMKRLTIQPELSSVSPPRTKTPSNKKPEPVIKVTRPASHNVPSDSQPRSLSSATKQSQDKAPRVKVRVEPEKKPSKEVATSSSACSVIRRSGPSETSSPLVLKSSVNSSATKTDVTMSEPRVQEATSNNSQESHIEVRNMYSDVNTESIESSSKEPYYDLQETEIDGLTLLASVSAQQRITSSSKKPELKVKPYSCLQERHPLKDVNLADDVEAINRIIGTHPEDSSEKMAVQVDMGVKQPQTMSAYVASTVEVMQNGLEANDNANVILNGETVMLMKKSPYSNLYIINKAAVDDEELTEPPDVKPNLLVKHEQTLVKPDPDEAKLFDMHYPSYPTPAYCPHPPPPPSHHSSTGCACVSCAYCRPPPYYSIASIASQADDGMVSRLKQFDSKLPLKKRLTAQRSVDLLTASEPSYPATLMMSIADVELKPPSGGVDSPLSLGATVEVTSSSEPKQQSRSRKNSSTATKGRKRKTATVDEKEEKEPKKPRKRAARKTTVITAGQACAELDPEWNPSGRRKRKRSGR